jgi:large subunit ribosomal protein L31e
MPEEKVFTVPLRDAFEKPRTKRAKIAIKIVREFLKKHMKAEDVKIGKSINEIVWRRGIQKPPRKIRIHALREGDVVYAELLGVNIKLPSAEELKKKEKKKEEKKKKIKEERKIKKTIQEEIEEESGKKVKEIEKIKKEGEKQEAKNENK